MKNDSNNIVSSEGSVIREMTEAEKAETAIITRNSYLKEKFRMSLKFYTKRKIQEYADIHADWRAKEVLVEIMKGYNPELQPVVLLEMTQFILDEWEKKQTHKSELTLA
jgi:hypothetical protein